MKRITLAFLALFSIIALAACSSAEQVSTFQDITIQTSTGETTVPSNPQKIVVLDYGVADSLRALGKEDTIVGMPKDSLPTYLKDLKDKKEITNVGNLREVNLETVAELEPDLIILSSRTQDQQAEFEKIAPAIYFENSTSDYLNSVKTNATELAKLFGDEAVKEAESKLADIDRLVQTAQDKNKNTQLTTLTVLLNEGSMAGIAPDGRYSFIYKTLGFQPTDLKLEENTQGNQGRSHGSSLSLESVSQINPDIIFVVDRTLAIGGDDTQNSDILNNALIQETNAGKNKKIITLTPDLWYLSGGGLESTKLMFEEVVAHLEK
ncbi:siderophore ABC transporter substrate-binding protein [Streptococcus suis]|uniref:siderophore ABC transporter substrate-binding protein n=1 Tax=Streptococcus suis TaxID=1307 RepID=UPI000CF55A52|nr:ABC transporter substrate-binding protein [Streptococcus suis]HEL2575215.1 ABC transporter substrate-binding protein [Streptococcus suis]